MFVSWLCREQKEKFNVWVAFLALENKYAETPETAAAALLQRALQHNDAKAMYLAAIDMFSKTGREDLLGTCVRGVQRKFGESCKVWLRLVRLNIARGLEPGGTLERATKSLAKRKHVKLLSRVGLMEFKEGSSERGRALFEGVLQTYPKRTDLWGMYIDQEIRSGDSASTRNVFERMIHLDLPAKKMRFFFKRYLEYESEHGSEERVAYVKRRAMEYVKSTS